MYTTYILYSSTTGRFYTGQCVDLKIRLAQHNSGRNKSSKDGKPWTIVYVAESDSRSEAVRLEEKIKSRGAKRFLKDLNIIVG